MACPIIAIAPLEKVEEKKENKESILFD